jgi:hypothetical protein
MIVSGVTRKIDQRPARKCSAQHCQKRTIGGSELGPSDLAAQHLELVAENVDLDVLGLLAAEGDGPAAAVRSPLTGWSLLVEAQAVGLTTVRR